MDHLKLKSLLAGRGTTQWRLARKMHMSPSTLSDYLRGARPSPDDLVPRLEKALGLPQGTLAAEPKQHHP